MRAGNQGRTELFRMKLVQLLAEKKRLETLIKTGIYALDFPGIAYRRFLLRFLTLPDRYELRILII